MSSRAHKTICALVLSIVVGFAGSVFARRLPAPGGSASLALPANLAETTLLAHTRVPLVEAIDGSETAAVRMARGQLGELPWRSSLLTELRPSLDLSSWELVAAADPATVGAALRDCLGPDSWPGRAISAAGLEPTVSDGRNPLTVSFERPVGPLPALLAGCAAEAPAAFGLEERRLVSRADALGGPALLSEVLLRDPPSAADVALGDPDRPTGTSLATRAPDVILLLQSADAREADPFGLRDGPARLLELLAPDVLLAVFWGGRGSRPDGLLPPGLAPSRPLPAGEAGPVPTLALDRLPPDAPRVELRHDPDDRLLAGTVARLAVVLRNRGYATGPGGTVIDVVRWRPESLDPAVVLLSLGGSYDALADPTLAEPALLAEDPDRRLEAALDVERRWMQEGRVVPLMFADRWIAVDPDLRGVRLRPDGVPLLHDAWWAVPR